MKTIKTLFIDIDKFYLIKDTNIKIEELNFTNININEEKNFYFNNFNYFIENKMINHCIRFLSLIKDLLSQEKIKKTINIIIDSNDEYYYERFCRYVLRKRAIESDLITKEEGKKIEDEILKNNIKSIYYSIDFVKGRWKELEEKLIKEKNTDVEAVIMYALEVLKNRWVNIKDIDPKITSELEKKIFENFDPKKEHNTSDTTDYIFLDNKRIFEIEDKIFNSSYIRKVEYIKEKIGERVPEVESIISKNPYEALEYAEFILKKPWSEVKEINQNIIDKAEKSISSSFYRRVPYAIFSKKRLNDKFEKMLFYNLDADATYEYIDELIKDRVPKFEEALEIMSREGIDEIIKSNKIYKQDTLLDDNTDIYNEEEELLVSLSLAKENAFNVGSEYIKKYMNGDWPEYFERKDKFFQSM